jgi:hypothetical protein
MKKTALILFSVMAITGSFLCGMQLEKAIIKKSTKVVGDLNIANTDSKNPEIYLSCNTDIPYIASQKTILLNVKLVK